MTSSARSAGWNTCLKATLQVLANPLRAQDVVSLLLKVGGLRNHGAAWRKIMSELALFRREADLLPEGELPRP